MKKCTIDWCEYKHFWIWYCQKHYQRYKKHWDPLICITAPNWENRKRNKLYRTYHSMKKRCYNINFSTYKNYWWRWIIVCDRWLWLDWFTNFCKDMWDRPEWHTLDRIDNNWNYSPENCKRSTIYEQAWNRRNNNKDVWVCRDKEFDKRAASINIDRKRINLWRFINYQEAVNARKEAEIKYNIIL